MKPLEEMLMYQKALRQRRTPSVMNQAPAPAWQPEYEKEPPLEAVSPEDFIPSPKTIAALAAKGGALAGSIKNVGLLRELLGPDSPQVRKMMAGQSPERALRGYQPMETGGAYPVLGNNVLRYETDRPTFNKNVVHYDASGGEQALQIAGLSHLKPSGDAMSVADRLRNIKSSQLRMQDISKIPEDQAKFVDYDPWFQQFGPKRSLDPAKPYEFYVNSGEGMVDEDVFELPMNLKMRDIINDPELRKAYNMSLAVPADSQFNMLARVLRDAK